jgi:hypothetical protein
MIHKGLPLTSLAGQPLGRAPSSDSANGAVLRNDEASLDAALFVS